MTVKTIRIDDLPKARRKRVSPIKKTRDWNEVIDRIKYSDFEAIQVEFSEETLKLGKSVPDRFRRMLQTEIKAMGLDSFLRVTFRGRSPNGAPVLYVIREQGMELPRRRRLRESTQLRERQKEQ